MEEFHNEADTRAKLIDPALYQRGWSEDKIKREETPGAVDVVDGKPRKRAHGRIDYTLRVRVNSDTQPVALALIEAKAIFSGTWPSARERICSSDQKT